MRKSVFKDKFYTHLDVKKRHEDYEERVKNSKWVSRHGFYPFIHFTLDFDKYKEVNNGEKQLITKERDIYYAAHIDRYIYQYYGSELNKAYDKYAKENRINKVAIAYRDCFPGKSNIDFAKEAFETVAKYESSYIFVGDFSKFFDRLDHSYLKSKIKSIYGGRALTEAEYAVFKSITCFSYVEADDIERFKGILRRDMRDFDKFFDTAEFHRFKKDYLKTNSKGYQIPQGSSISAIYANVYMIDFDVAINDYISSLGGIYRRYCDDIIIILPMDEEMINNKSYKEYTEFIYRIRDTVPNLELNPDKTEQFYYEKGNIIKISGSSNQINYLGFSFDGTTVSIRDKSLFKYYCRAYKKIKRVKEVETENAFIAGKKAIYQAYSHLGVKKFQSGYGNFISYAYKAHEKMSNSEYIESNIRNQVKRHWHKIDSRLKG